MFVKKSDIFRSRWKALIWAGGVLLTAYCSVPSPDDTAQDSHAKSAAHDPSQQAANPWALDHSAKP